MKGFTDIKDCSIDWNLKWRKYYVKAVRHGHQHLQLKNTLAWKVYFLLIVYYLLVNCLLRVGSNGEVFHLAFSMIGTRVDTSNIKKNILCYIFELIHVTVKWRQRSVPIILLVKQILALYLVTHISEFRFGAIQSTKRLLWTEKSVKKYLLSNSF